MKEDLKTIFYVGLGALSETNDKFKTIKSELYNRGKELYEKGIVANEELKHNMKEVMKDNVTVVNVNVNSSKNDLIKNFNDLSLKDKKEVLKVLNKKGWTDVNYENGENEKES